MHSHSATSTFNNCPWKHRLQQLGYKAQQLDAKSNDRLWAIALHAGLRTLYQARPMSEVEESFARLYPEMLDPSDITRTVSSGLIVLKAYAERYPQDCNEWEVLETEFDNPEDERAEHGHLVIDLVMRHRASGSVYFWDHKVKRKWDGSGKQYEMDAQLSRYASYVKERWGDCAGAMVNVIVPHYRERKWKDRPSGWDIQFDRKLYSRTADQIEAWHNSQQNWEQMIKICDENELWPKHYGSLCSYCEYFDGCYAQSQGSGMEIFEALYKPGYQPGDQNLEIELEE